MFEFFDTWELDGEWMNGASAALNIDYRYQRTERRNGYEMHAWVSRICEKTNSTNIRHRPAEFFKPELGGLLKSEEAGKLDFIFKG